MTVSRRKFLKVAGVAGCALLTGRKPAEAAGAAEAAILPVTMAGMNVMGALSTRNDDPATASRPWDKDRDGFVLGDGVWEGLRLHRGRFAFLDAHLDRLYEAKEALEEMARRPARGPTKIASMPQSS